MWARVWVQVTVVAYEGPSKPTPPRPVVLPFPSLLHEHSLTQTNHHLHGRLVRPRPLRLTPTEHSEIIHQIAAVCCRARPRILIRKCIGSAREIMHFEFKANRADVSVAPPLDHRQLDIAMHTQRIRQLDNSPSAM